jgi:hypothetical protein
MREAPLAGAEAAPARVRRGGIRCWSLRLSLGSTSSTFTIAARDFAPISARPGSAGHQNWKTVSREGRPVAHLSERGQLDAVEASQPVSFGQLPRLPAQRIGRVEVS